MDPPVSGEDATRTAPTAWWRNLFQLLDEAFELKTEERAAYLERASEGDPAIANAAAEMLVGAEARTFLAGPAAEFAAPFLSNFAGDFEPESVGLQVGPYRILHEIGHGGMGTVYLAERADTQYKKRVAIKLLPRWSARNERLVRRFVEERQILAALDHPDIARLLDGGVTVEGLPWFAMEYVDGQPVDVHCKQNNLTRESRLKLFCRVCAAVQYAHRNLVVHRDLKPGNILVTAGGDVKLLDFGIAKLLGGDGPDSVASLTLTRDRMMTPLYASPEQLRGDPISTATDVYALGLLLSELLTGRYPYKLTTREPHEVARAVLEQDPMPPSLAAPKELARHLRGDLDIIVLKAMRKDPGQRYGTAEQLEADVRRHLGRLPLAARPETRSSRAQKFVARHRAGVATTVGVGLLLLAFGVVSAVQTIRIRSQAARIATERDRAEQVSGFLAGLFRASDPYGSGTAALTAREMLDSGAARIDRELAAQPDARAQMMFEIGRAYYGLGALPRARRFVETSLAIRRRATPDAKLEIARSLDFLGLVLSSQGELDAAEQAYRDALRARRELLGARHPEVARTLNGLAAVLRSAGRPGEADSLSRAAVGIDEGGTNPINLAESLEGLAEALQDRGNFATAEPLFRRAVQLRERTLGPAHPEVGRSLIRWAGAVGRLGRTSSGDSLFRRGLEIERRILGDDHPDVAAGEGEHGRLLHSVGRDAEAEVAYDHALAIARRKLPAVHPLTATLLLNIGELNLDRGLAARAEQMLKEADAMRRVVLPPLHPEIAEAEQLVGAAILARHSYAEAERYLLPSYAQLRTSYGDDDSRTRAALRRLIGLYQSSRQPQLAARYRDQLEGRPGTEQVVPARELEGARNGKPRGITVLAFEMRDAHPSLADLRNWLQDLLAMRLRGSENSPSFDFSAHILTGAIAGTPERLAVSARMINSSGGRVRSHFMVTGPADSLPQVADRLAVGLLASAGSETAEDSAALAATSLPALQAYFAGRTAFRRNRPRDARNNFERALALDSTFLFPYLWLASLEEAHFTAGAERWRFDAAWRRKDQLPAGARALLLAHLGPRYPSAPTMAELIAAGEEATRVAPDWAEAWFIAGENLARFGSLVGPSDWLPRARAAFTRAVALDPAHGPALDRLLLADIQAGDVESARRDFALYFAQNAKWDFEAFDSWAAAMLLGDSGILTNVRSRLPDLPEMDLLRMAVWSQARGVGMADGDSAARLLFARGTDGSSRRLGTQHLIIMLLNRGRPTEANRLLDTFELGFGPNQAVGGVREFQVHARLYWDGDSTAAAVAVGRLEAYIAGAPMGPGEIGNRQSAGCALAHWRIASRDFNGARTALRWMRRNTRAPGAPRPIISPICAAVVEAQLEEANARSTGVALARLDSLLLSASNFRDQLIAIGNLTAARLHAARGDKQQALDIIGRHTIWSAYLSTQLREEGRLASLNGDRARAIRAYRHYVVLRSEPESRLKSEVEAVKRELARLAK